jgi:hypothetical protein
LHPTDRGHWTSSGEHAAGSQNYVAGDYGLGPRRSYFTFSLVGVPASGGGITGATLSVTNPASGAGTARPYTLWNVATPAAALEADDLGDAAGIAIYTDLGSGTTLGSVTPATLATTPIDVPLNAFGISALNAARGGTISLGGDLTGAVASNDWMFGSSDIPDGVPATAVSLTLTIAAPTTLSLKAPAKVAKGTKVTVSGKLASTPADPACEDAQPLTATAGGTSIPATTDIGGAYSFKVRITKMTTVKVAYGGNANCAAAKAKQVIRLR